MTREEAKNLFRNDKDSYGKPKAVMSKIDQIYDDFEKEMENRFTIEEIKKYVTSRDSFGDVCYFLNAENIRFVNLKDEDFEDF